MLNLIALDKQFTLMRISGFSFCFVFWVLFVCLFLEVRYFNSALAIDTVSSKQERQQDQQDGSSGGGAYYQAQKPVLGSQDPQSRRKLTSEVVFWPPHICHNTSMHAHTNK